MDQWIQYKLGKQYLLKENYTTWESNPGPTPIRGDPATLVASVGFFLDHSCWTFELSSLNFGLNIGEEDSRKGRSDQGAVWPHRQHRPGNCQVTGFETASWPLVNDQDVWQLSKEVVAELKEVFMLFDKDED